MINPLKILSEMMRGRPIATGRVYLRPPHRRDWKQWLKLRGTSRDFLEPWEPTWPANALTRKAYIRRLKAYAMHSSSDTGYTFFVFRRSDGALLGNISLNNVRRGVSQNCSIGYWIGARYAKQGYMTEALAALLPFAFKSLRLHRIEAACLPTNEASQALLRRVGFSEEGYARSYLKINGEWQDHVLFATLNADPRPVPVTATAPAEQRLRPARAMAAAEVYGRASGDTLNTRA